MESTNCSLIIYAQWHLGNQPTLTLVSLCSTAKRLNYGKVANPEDVARPCYQPIDERSFAENLSPKHTNIFNHAISIKRIAQKGITQKSSIYLSFRYFMEIWNHFRFFPIAAPSSLFKATVRLEFLAFTGRTNEGDRPFVPPGICILNGI